MDMVYLDCNTYDKMQDPLFLDLYYYRVFQYPTLTAYFIQKLMFPVSNSRL